MFNIDIKSELPGNFDRYFFLVKKLSNSTNSDRDGDREVNGAAEAVFPRCADKYYFAVWDLAALSPTRRKICYVIKLNADLVECVLH